MNSSQPPSPNGFPQQPGFGPQTPGQGSPYPLGSPGHAPGAQPQQPLPQFQQQPQHPQQPHGGWQPQSSPQMQPAFAAGAYQGGPGQQAPAQRPPKDFVVAWLLALFLGFLGADRFYRGFIGLGILKLITCGGAGIWSLIDLLLIVFSGGRDSSGQRLAGYERSKKVAYIVTPIVLAIGLIFSLVNSATSGGDSAAPEPAQVAAVVPAEVEEAAEEEPAVEEEVVAEEETTAPEPTEEETTSEAPAPKPAAEVPATQQAMSDAVAQGREDAEGAETDLQRANVLNVRSEGMCQSVPKGAVQDWVGTVVTVDANGEGKAVVVISIEDDIEIGTWNNAFSDISDNTLIEQGTDLYDAALGLVPGDSVRFSGTLKTGSSGNDECYYTSNLTETMSIDSPDYIINFSDLQKVE